MTSRQDDGSASTRVTRGTCGWTPGGGGSDVIVLTVAVVTRTRPVSIRTGGCALKVFLGFKDIV